MRLQELFHSTKTTEKNLLGGYTNNAYSRPERAAEIPKWVPEPPVEVMMPVYNQDEYLESSVQSVLSQDYSSLKLRIIDDGSDTAATERLKAFSDNEKLTIQRQNNKGLPETLNNLSTTCFSRIPPAELTTWHSGDNIYSQNAIRIMAHFLIANPDISLAFSNVRLIDEKGVPYQNSDYRRQDQDPSDSSILNLKYSSRLLSLFNDNFINASFLFRTELDRLVPPYQPSDLGYEDYKHWLMLTGLADGAHIGYPQPLYEYRLHRNALSSTLSQESLRKKQLPFVKRAALAQKVISGEIPAILSSSNHTFKLEIPESHTKETLTLHPVPLEDFCIHKSHLNSLSFPAYTLENNLSYLQTLPASFNVSEALLRSRGKYLGAYGSQLPDEGIIGIFAPSDSELHEGEISRFISVHPDCGFILIAQSESERASSDRIFLGTSCAKNIRIIDTREFSSSEYDLYNPSLLYALGSVDAIASLLAFESADTLKKRTTHFGFHPVTDQIDFIAEASFAAAVKRPLLAPAHYSFLCRNPTRTLPVVFPWSSSETLPGNLIDYKNDISENSCDATLRAFAPDHRRRQILSMILNGFINS